MMNKTITWEAIEYVSREHCAVEIDQYGLKAISTIDGIYADEPFKVAYELYANELFETGTLLIKASYGSTKWDITLRCKNGIWYMNNKVHPEFTGCTDVDIATTPLTNTLPIRRLSLGVNEEREIRVVYFDLFKGEIKALSQRYRKLSEHAYHYENIPNDFEADIKVDDEGLVVNYPGLFTRS